MLKVKFSKAWFELQLKIKISVYGIFFFKYPNNFIKLKRLLEKMANGRPLSLWPGVENQDLFNSALYVVCKEKDLDQLEKHTNDITLGVQQDTDVFMLALTLCA